MTCIFTIEAPDGTREIVNEKGKPVNHEDAQPFTGSMREANEELAARSARWIARGDCFARDARIEPVSKL